MNRDRRSRVLLGAIVLQLLVLAGVLLGAVYPRWFGQEVQLVVEPVDPRSLFRGNYAQLRYVIGEVDVTETQRPLRYGERVYVSLEPAADGSMRARGLALQRPGDGLFIRGRVASRAGLAGGGSVQVRYGIEAYFLPQDKALALEKALRQGPALATVRIAPDGKAALLQVAASPPAG